MFHRHTNAESVNPESNHDAEIAKTPALAAFFTAASQLKESRPSARLPRSLKTDPSWRSVMHWSCLSLSRFQSKNFLA